MAFVQRAPWQPGMPVVTEQDETDWLAWKRESALRAQRARRRRARRIDYYASPEACAIVDGMRAPGIGGDASSIINRAITEWAVAARRASSSG